MDIDVPCKFFYRGFLYIFLRLLLTFFERSYYSHQDWIYVIKMITIDQKILLQFKIMVFYFYIL